MIYWLGGAEHMMAGFANRDEVPEGWQRENYDFLREIEGRYISGFYTGEQIAVDPANIDGDSTDYTKLSQVEGAARQIPDVMYHPTSGRRLERDGKYGDGRIPELDEDEKDLWVELHHYGRADVPISLARKPGGGCPEVAGWVLAIGAEWFLMAVITDDLRPTGFRALRWRDFGRCAGVDGTMIEQAFAIRGDTVPEPPRIGLDDTESLLRTAGAAFPLLTIWIENRAHGVAEPHRTEPSTVRVDVAGDRALFVREITLHAQWGRPFRPPLDLIGRVDFDGTYQQMVANLRGSVPGT